MTHTQRRSHKAALALGAVLAITPLAAPAVVMPSAIAAPASPLIDFTQSGSLSLSNMDSKLQYNLWKVEEWNSATDVKSYGVSLDEVKAKLTEAKGNEANKVAPAQAGKWSNLHLGVYIVEPTAIEGDNTSKVQAAQPFFVYIPTTDPTNRDAWTYDLAVTLKDNSQDTTKAITDAAGNTVTKPANVGETIYYTVTGAVPQNPDKDDTTAWLTKYEVLDNLWADGGDDNLSNWTVQAVALKSADEEETLSLTTHYTVENGKVAFTPEGLTKIATFKNENLDAKVRVVFGATVQKVAGTDGFVSNTATVTWKVKNEDDTNNPSNPGTDGNTTPVTSQWVKIRATKVDNADANKKLEGAEFALYKCTVGDNDAVDRSTITDANKLTVDGKTAFATGANGALYIDGVNQAYGKLCLVETKAPENYELSDTPIVVDLSSPTKSADTTTGVADTKEVSIEKDNITNVKSRFPSLPITGGVGIAIFAALAAGIAAATVWATRRAARRS